MAGKIKAQFICSSCGYENPKWFGRCPHVETVVLITRAKE
ncbi:MAG: hypothetical protein GX241_00340 [Ruminococcaceae bacterium]|nr:hypothetical protein [Oscillospiraceae bacterium]